MTKLNATLVHKEELSPGLYLLRVLPDNSVPDFLPGQYVALALPASAPGIGNPGIPEKYQSNPEKLIKRAYSIGSAPAQKEAYEFYVAFVEDGELTPRLLFLEVDDRLFCAEKVVGTFTTEPLEEHGLVDRLILVSTGTGIAPFISMLRDEAIWKRARSVVVLHGVRYACDLAYDGELRRLEEEKGEAFRYFSTTSREGEEWKGARGYVQEFFTRGELTVDCKRDQIFLCGNPGMIEQLEEMFTGEGFVTHTRKHSGNLHVEKYW